ncbi:MAG: DNA translocase FtsK 4TM domain-containing protein [Eubacteriales bacterium]
MATKKQKTTKKKSNNTAKKQKNNFKDEIIILIVIAISMLLFVSIYTNKAGVVGSSINKIIFGLVGITAFAIPFYMIGITIFKLANKKNKFANRKIVFSSIVLFVATIVAQIIQGNNKTGIFEGLTTYFSKSAELKEGGGLIGGFFADILLELFGRWGTYIVLGVVFVVLMVLLTEKSFIKLVKKISAYLYNKFNSYTKKHNKKTKQQKPNSTKEDNSFTIQSFQDDQDLTKGKEFTYASKDDSNMLDRVTIPAGEQGEQLTFVGNEKMKQYQKNKKKTNYH